MSTITCAEALVKYEPLIVHECQRAWDPANYVTQFAPCELPDLIQSARLRIIEKWNLLDPRRPVAAYLRRIAYTAAITCLRREARQALYPIDLTESDAT